MDRHVVVVMRRLAVAVAAAALVAIASPAHAAPAPTTIQGQVLRLVSIQDAAAMASMVPGVPVAWDLGVSASRDDGSIDLRLESQVTDDAFALAISSCATPWTATGCVGGATTLVESALVDGVVELGTQSAADERWYRVAVTLTGDGGDHRADLVFRAAGMGESVSSDAGAQLPPTGGTVPGAAFALAALAVAIGILCGAAARRRRSVEVPG